MKNKKNMRRFLSGFLAMLTVLSTILSPMLSYAADVVPAPEEPPLYEEIKNDKDDFYKFAVKLYKNDENQYAMLYVYNNPFSVCGTGRKTEDIILNNGKNSIVGYYDNSKYWSDISFFSINENIAVINNNLKDNEADEVINFIKTLNITEVN